MSVPYIDVNMFTDDFLEELRQHGDPEADDAIHQFIDHELGSEGLLKDKLIEHHPGSDEASAVLGAFVDEYPPLPDWADLEMFEEGQRIFAEFVPQIGLALWMASIPAGYAGARDVVVLERTGELVSHPQRRFLETGQFVIDVMQPGSLEPGAKGAADIRHVRLMHAAVRHMLVHEADQLTMSETGEKCPPWDFSTGKPLNQEALLATQFTFSVVGIQSLDRFGVHLSQYQRDCYTHAWAIIGHLMGVRADLQPLNYADSAIVWERIKAKEYPWERLAGKPSVRERVAMRRATRDAQRKTDPGEHLAEHALLVMQQMIPGRVVDGIPAAGINFLLGRDVARLLDVPNNWTYAFFPPMHWLGELTNRFGKHSPLGRKFTEWAGRKFFQAFIDLEWNEAKTRPRNFEVPDQIARRLDLDLPGERMR